MNIVCDIFNPVMKAMKSINLALLIFGVLLIFSFKSKADTQVAIFGNKWRMRLVEPREVVSWEDVAGERGFVPWNPAKADCDNPSRTFQNLASIAMIANKIEGGSEGSYPKEEVRSSELADKDKVTSDIVDVLSGQGTVVSENNCYSIVSTVFHNLALREGKKVTTTTTSKSGITEFGFIKRFNAESGLGEVLDFVSLPNKGSTLEKNEEATLVIIKKPGCDSLPASQKFANARHHKIYDFSNPITHLLDMARDRSGEAGVMTICNYENKLQSQRGGISRIQITKDGKQDLAVLNTTVQTGNSGCPVVYRDSQGVDHIIGMASATAGRENAQRIVDASGIERMQSSRTLVTLFTNDMAKKLEEIRKNPAYFR